jgi:hypothetical protein
MMLYWFLIAAWQSNLHVTLLKAENHSTHKMGGILDKKSQQETIAGLQILTSNVVWVSVW